MELDAATAKMEEGEKTVDGSEIGEQSFYEQSVVGCYCLDKMSGSMVCIAFSLH